MSQQAQSESDPAAETPEEAAGTDIEPGPGDAAEAQPEGGETAGAGPLETALGEAARWKDLAARAQAELDNYRKRMTRDKADAIKFANAGLLEDLLPVIDNFQMGLDAAKADGEDSIIARGMEMVQKQLGEFLAAQGVVEVQAIGEAFDPNLHEAISQEHSDEVPEGHVVGILRRGFRLKDRLLRAANVTVSKGPAPAGDGGQ